MLACVDVEHWDEFARFNSNGQVFVWWKSRFHMNNLIVEQRGYFKPYVKFLSHPDFVGCNMSRLIDCDPSFIVSKFNKRF